MRHFLRTTAIAVVFTFGCQGAFAAQDNEAFVEDASAKGVAEVEAGKLAQEKGSAADVKSFAKMMVTDHTMANIKLKEIANSKKISSVFRRPTGHRG